MATRSYPPAGWDPSQGPPPVPTPPPFPWWKVGVGVAITAAVVLLLTFLMSLRSVAQDEVAFRVGGGPFDAHKHQIKGDMQTPGLKVMGPWDGVWKFPAYKTLRFQDFQMKVTTYDGRTVTIEGQVGFRFVGEHDPALAKKFAEGLGARKYGGKRPGDSAGEGWSNFLDQLFVPTIKDTFRVEFGKRYCAAFEPSCRAIDPRSDVPSSAANEVYAHIVPILQANTNKKLGGPYLLDMRIQMSSVRLDPEVRRNIERVGAEQAKTQAALQSEKTAKAEAKAIETTAAARRRNPSSILLDVAKACDGGNKCTIVLDGSKGGVNATVK